MSNENGKLLCQIGKMVVSASLEKGGKIKSSSQGVKPYGFISVDKAWAMKVEKSSFSGFGTKTTTTTQSDPRRILRPEYLGTHFVVFADKAIIRVNKDGKVAWTHKWKYDPDQRNLLFDPVFVGANDDVIYACKGSTASTARAERSSGKTRT